MKDKLLQMRVDEEFLEKLDYMRKINGYKTIAETVRKIFEKEYRKEIEQVEAPRWLGGEAKMLYKMEYYQGCNVSALCLYSQAVEKFMKYEALYRDTKIEQYYTLCETYRKITVNAWKEFEGETKNEKL